MAEGSGQARRLEPSWLPEALAEWCAPGGPLHDTGTLADLCESGPEILDPGSPDRTGDSVTTRTAELGSLGAGVGDVVCWQLPNCNDSVAMYRACWQLGATAAPLHHLAGPAEVEAMMSGLGCSVLLDPDGQPGGRLERVMERPSDGDHPGGPGLLGRRPSGSDIAVVLHTSGSSGTPKGVMHTHRALAYKARTMATLHGLGADDAVLMPAPLAHVSGLLNGILVPSVAGMRTVLMSRWDTEAALGLIESERITFMVGPPTFFIGLEHADGFSPQRVESLRVLSVGGAGVTPEFVERTSELFGAEVKRSYGSTEAPTVASSPAGDDPWSRAHTDGRPTGAVRIRIVDPTTGVPRTTGEAGEVQLSGPELFCGYTDRAATAAATTGDWFRTGDVGVLDTAGRLTITGRIGNVIIRGGENIDAAEVEAHLVAHPGVSAAVVLGEPDERLGERVVAVVELAPQASGFELEECRDWFVRRGVARFKTPERIVEVAHMPLLASGKADRTGLQRSLAEE
jgi:acyl-CoA synthetase (AMP-forming)/AMP-acid ligase II